MSDLILTFDELTKKPKCYVPTDSLSSGTVPSVSNEDLVCEPTATGYPTLSQVAVFVAKGHKYSNTDITNHTNTCTHGVINSHNSSVSSDESSPGAVLASWDSSVSGNNSTVLAAFASTASGQRSIATGDTNTVSGNDSLTGGKNNQAGADKAIHYGWNNIATGGESFALVGYGNTLTNCKNGIHSGSSNTCNDVIACGQFDEAGSHNNIRNCLLSGYGLDTSNMQNCHVTGLDLTVTGTAGSAPNSSLFSGSNSEYSGWLQNSSFLGYGNKMVFDETIHCHFHLWGSKVSTTAQSINGTLATNNNNKFWGVYAFGRNFAVPRTNYRCYWGFNPNAEQVGDANSITATLDYLNGNMILKGSVTTSAVFAGFGEYAIKDGDIPRGRFVRFVGESGVRLCKANEQADGISKVVLNISPGGGIDPKNTEFVLDEFGEVIYETVLVDGQTLEVPKRNDNYDETLSRDTTGVELLGRCWVEHDGTAQVDKYLTSSNDGIGTASNSGYRVLAVKENKALVLVK